MRPEPNTFGVMDNHPSYWLINLSCDIHARVVLFNVSKPSHKTIKSVMSWLKQDVFSRAIASCKCNLVAVFQIVPRIEQKDRQEPNVARLLDRVVEVERVRVRGRDDCEQNHVACYIGELQILYIHNMPGARDYNPPPPFFSSSTPFNHQIQESAAVKAYDAELKWFSSPEAKQRSAAAKSHALAEFKKRFLRANMSKFITQVDFDANRKATGRVLFPDGDGSWEDALIEDSKY